MEDVWVNAVRGLNAPVAAKADAIILRSTARRGVAVLLSSRGMLVLRSFGSSSDGGRRQGAAAPGG